MTWNSMCNCLDYTHIYQMEKWFKRYEFKGSVGKEVSRRIHFTNEVSYKGHPGYFALKE